jgi:predicted RecB family nuclease
VNITLEPMTASRMACFQACPRRHYWRYERGVVRAAAGDALRFGSAWHRAMEARAKGSPVDEQFVLAVGSCTLDETQAATLAGLLHGYSVRYGTDSFTEEVCAERRFRLETPTSRRFTLDGVIDCLVKDGDTWALREYKTTSDSLDSGSDYWLRLRANAQVLHYVDCARASGYNVAKVIYDVTRKPSIRPKQGETADQYRERLAADTLTRPEFYFARREIAVLDADLEEYRETRTGIMRMVLHCRREQKWPRHVSADTCRLCDYADYCLAGIPLVPPPNGFMLGEQFPELKETKEETPAT